MDRWIALVSGLAGFITAVATLFTVREMKKQRISSYLPDLFFPKTILYVYRDEDGSVFASSEENLSKSSHLEILNKRNYAFLEILNIGAGAAREVILKWDCDVDAFINIISKLDVGRTIEHEEGVLKIDNSSSFIFNQCDDEVLHIAPMHIEPKPIRCKIPIFYLELYSLYFYHTFCTRKVGTIYGYEDPTPLELYLTYKDIGNNRHELSLSIKPDFDMAWGTGSGLSCVGDAALKVTRIK
ncbi:MAG: hypothetical protein AABN95_02000 [Acidobacteriota bacterium]